jgi:hypothetical protein
MKERRPPERSALVAAVLPAGFPGPRVKVYEVGVAAGVAAPGVSTTGVEPTATTGVASAAGVAAPIG